MDRKDFIKKAALGVAAVAATSLLNSPVMAAVNENINNKKENKTMKKILILNGSSRRNGYTSALVDAFAEGAYKDDPIQWESQRLLESLS